jgi:uncharacterized protein YkwD
LAVVALAVGGLALKPRSEARVAAAPDAPGCPSSGAVPDATTSEPAKQAVLCLLNAERARHGLGHLVRDDSLELASQRHSEDMAARDFFEHDTPDGITTALRIARAGYPVFHTTTAENLYWGEDEKSTPVSAQRSWMRSPGHRANILLPELRVVGIGIAYEAPLTGRADHRAAVYTTDFGSLQRER